LSGLSQDRTDDGARSVCDSLGPGNRIERRFMQLDEDKIDDAVLALLHLGLHDHDRAWKGFDWDALRRLHEKGFIGNPVGKAKSVVMTEAGLRRSEALREELFGR
jgi:hypothetical protein